MTFEDFFKPSIRLFYLVYDRPTFYMIVYPIIQLFNPLTRLFILLMIVYFLHNFLTFLHHHLSFYTIVYFLYDLLIFLIRSFNFLHNHLTSSKLSPILLLTNNDFQLRYESYNSSPLFGISSLKF